MKIKKDEAISKITEMTLKLAEEINVDSDLTLAAVIKPFDLNFRVTKMVLNILAYCNRRDFPEPLIYTVAKYFLDDYKAQNEALKYEDGLVNKLKMGDTEFGFNTSIPETKFEFDTRILKAKTSTIDDEDFFNELKPKLNLYRRIKAL